MDRRFNFHFWMYAVTPFFRDRNRCPLVYTRDQGAVKAVDILYQQHSHSLIKLGPQQTKGIKKTKTDNNYF